MGDDNVLLTHWHITRLSEFLLFFEAHALSRFGMVLSRQKSIITTLRTRIEMLGYTCNGGHPKRPIPKLVAQLCFPEHGPIDKYMSARAIGIAWASAATDVNFHAFCKDVYLTFLPYAEPLTPDATNTILKHMPGMFKMLDSVEDFLQHDRFPTIEEISHRYSHWSGELDPDKKWNPSHFTSTPESSSKSNLTMQEYMSRNDIKFPELQQFFV